MARYDGMEDLLRRVSETMAVRHPESRETGVTVAEQGPQYADLLEQVLLVVRDMTEVTQILPEIAAGLTAEQQTDMMSLFGKVRHQLRECERQIAR